MLKTLFRLSIIGTERLLKYMKDLGVPVNPNSLQLLDKAYGKVQRLENLVGLVPAVKGVIAAHAAEHAHALNESLLTYTHTKQFTKAEGVLRQMAASSIRPSPVAFRLLVENLVQSNQLQLLDTVVQHAESLNMPLDNGMLKTLFGAYATSKQVDRLHLMVQRMREAASPDPELVSAAAGAYLRAQCVEHADAMLTGLLSADLPSTASIWADVIKYVVALGRPADVDRVLQHMHKSGDSPSTESYQALLLACAQHRQFKSLEKVRAAAIRQRVTIDLATYNAVLKEYAHAVPIDGVEGVSQWVAARMMLGVRPDAITYSILVGIYASIEDVEAVGRLLQVMQDEGISPSQPPLVALAALYGRRKYQTQLQRLRQALQSAATSNDDPILQLLRAIEQVIRDGPGIGNPKSNTRHKAGPSHKPLLKFVQYYSPHLPLPGSFPGAIFDLEDMDRVQQVLGPHIP